MSKYSKGDTVRVTPPDHFYFDKVGVVDEPRPEGVRPAYYVRFPDDNRRWYCYETELTLADPDVHTVLDEMDAESTAPARGGWIKPSKGMDEREIDGEVTRHLNVRAQTLRTAESLVNGDRADAYGEPAVNFGRIGNLWAEILGVPVRPEQVALCMAQVKIARLITSPTHDDSWVDLCGYAALGSEIADTP